MARLELELLPGPEPATRFARRQRDMLVTMIHQGRTRAYLVDRADAVSVTGLVPDRDRSTWPTATSCPPGRSPSRELVSVVPCGAGWWWSRRLGGEACQDRACGRVRPRPRRRGRRGEPVVLARAAAGAAIG